MADKRNWDRIRNQKPTDTVKNRDVYEDQQLERGHLAKKESMLSRNIINGIVSTLVFVVVWFFASLVEMMFAGGSGRESNGNPAVDWIHVNPYYVNINDESDKLTPDEYDLLLASYDPTLPEIDEPVKPENPSGYRKEWIDGWSYVAPDGTVYPEAEYNALKESYDLLKEQYEQEMLDYKAYCQMRVNPADTYKSQVEHYRSVFDPSVYILPEEYEQKVADYETEKSKGKISEDMLDVPDCPVNPASLYIPCEYDYPDMIDIDLSDPDGSEDAGMEKVPVRYANRFDAVKISSYEYDNLVAEYDIAYEAYQTAYQTHRETYHPDNIDGTAKILNLGFTSKKFLASFLVALIVFSLLYHVLSKNLKAQNLLSDTSDINQYHNDQHVALPEEVQRNYDWFPDVGAHSAVQVSSMISHMALQNKGLKTVFLADRAEKDIVDQNGNVEYYKGEILQSEDGSLIGRTVPIIDEKFMEDLFEASGAPNDKNIRKRYDATKIPYNPDGKNRDKLGKYATVADLINEDWEFPEYEPQRPGGAYIVDTAPVNTMVLAM